MYDVVGRLIALMDVRKNSTDIYYFIARTILLHIDEVADMGIEELALLCYTSPATISRFCRKIQLDSFADLRHYISQAHAYYNEEVRFTKDELMAINEQPQWLPDKLFPISIEAITETYRLLDMAVIQQVIDAIYSATQVAFFGSDYSQLVARDGQYKFIRLGKFVTAFSDVKNQEEDANQLQNGAVAVFFSVSGESKQVNHLCRLAMKRGAQIVVITNNRKSTLAKKADFVIEVGGVESTFTNSSISGRMALMSIVDILYTMYAYKVQIMENEV
ncbi:MurR/RpiR family transcriptional regulator [Culicoidibacter larvae]|uniref:MurR/RpiR family transcriptional regulator n=1 Tax=Culicoidibacter larvae TaxID=2579976 RepID=A0A5R8QBI9_9FIRM|nr:MurR/RpiR family transcriptional regulator [Culicoidibacter larvae]TLG73872.1 MurR/RpiR family transcriptional regulator [Culicoidibacter larvae]